jgi:hypothetical protein
MTQTRFEAETINQRLGNLHAAVRRELPPITRISVALHDAETDRLRTFAHSTLGEVPLIRYEAGLDAMPCLASLAEDGATRVIDDLRTWPGCDREHTRRLIASGYRSSLTMPLYDRGSFLGFLFYDAAAPGYFESALQTRLEVFSRLAEATIASDLAQIRLLRAAVRATRRIGRLRDEETGAHLERMSRFARCIAQHLADRYDLDDEAIAFLTMFAPLHDIGKIGVPDRVLLKPGPLDDDELRIMRSHVEVGEELMEMLLSELGVASLPHVTMLRNIVLHHHEASDGSGYPNELDGESIPIEARIVRVADVFDALTSRRPYKDAWSDDDAFAMLTGPAQAQFDADCVAALITSRERITEIRARFHDGFEATSGHEGYAADL